ncbi:MAG: GntR family transcriptional regulator [Galbitalea sp.]
MSSVPVLDVRSVVDALYDVVRGQILSGEIESGSKLTELVIANRFSVARPTARAVMERLATVGLLQRSVNKAARVPVLQPADIDDLYLTPATHRA